MRRGDKQSDVNPPAKAEVAVWEWQQASKWQTGRVFVGGCRRRDVWFAGRQHKQGRPREEAAVSSVCRCVGV